MELDENPDYEEEMLLFANFDFLILDDLSESNVDIKVIGVETQNPIIQVNGNIYKGSYDFSMGTNLFFGKDDNPRPLDNLHDVNPATIQKYIGKSEKILKMHRIFVEDNCNQNESSTEETTEELRKRFELKMNYGEALNMLLPPGAKPPREIGSDENYVYRNVRLKPNVNLKVLSQPDNDSAKTTNEVHVSPSGSTAAMAASES